MSDQNSTHLFLRVSKDSDGLPSTFPSRFDHYMDNLDFEALDVEYKDNKNNIEREYLEYPDDYENIAYVHHTHIFASVGFLTDLLNRQNYMVKVEQTDGVVTKVIVEMRLDESGE